MLPLADVIERGRARPLPVADLGQVLAASVTQWFESAVGDSLAGIDRAGPL